MNRDQLDKFERQVTALAIDYGISSLGITVMYRDDGPTRCHRFAALFIPNPHMGGNAGYLIHKSIFELCVATLKTHPDAHTISEEIHNITVVPGKPKGGTHGS